MEIDWKNLEFKYMPVKSHIRYSYRNGKWGEGQLSNDPNITLSIAATCFHYGQAAFEGLKVFRCKDGKARIFRPEENAKRLQSTANHIMAPEVPHDIFMEAVFQVVKDNADYIPPYGTGGSLYIRPLLIGTSAQIGISPSLDYEFIVMAMPVGAYYKGGIKPVHAYLVEEFDRAAPSGTGHVKVAGNYAAGLKPRALAHSKGASIALFLDAKEHKYIEEFGTSNFIAITKDNKYVTPDSSSILRSITNLSLMKIAEDCGMTVERRPVHKDELADFAEIGACGTAVIITPVKSIMSEGITCTYSDDIGPVLKKLHERMIGIQYGELPDTYNWLVELDT